jgi:hypothetical protein
MRSSPSPRCPAVIEDCANPADGARIRPKGDPRRRNVDAPDLSIVAIVRHDVVADSRAHEVQLDLAGIGDSVDRAACRFRRRGKGRVCRSVCRQRLSEAGIVLVDAAYREFGLRAPQGFGAPPRVADDI